MIPRYYLNTDAARNSGNVLCPACSVRRALTSAFRSNGGTSVVQVSRGRALIHHSAYIGLMQALASKWRTAE
jgi:hypothetical protein